MSGDEILNIFKKTGGYITNSHIVYTSGKHGETYLNKDAIYPHTREISTICKELAQRYKDKKIEVVAAPAIGGIILSQWTAHHLSEITGIQVLAVFTEKTPDKNLPAQTGQIFTRGYDMLIIGKKVLIVEDIATTGGSVIKVINSVQQAGGQVVGVCVIANRNPENVNSKLFNVPFTALAEIKMDAWEEKECPLCKKGVPINTTVGKGREYILSKS